MAADNLPTARVAVGILDTALFGLSNLTKLV